MRRPPQANKGYGPDAVPRDAYIEKNRELDAIMETVQTRRRELEDNTALLRKSGAIEAAMAQFCEAAKLRFRKCDDFATKRKFLLDYVRKVVLLKDKVSLHGSVPIKIKVGPDAETSELPFCIESEITPEERRREKLRTMQEMEYQQSLALLRKQEAGSLPGAA